MRAVPSRYRILRSDYRAQAVAIFVGMWVVLAATIGFGSSFRDPMLVAIFGGMTMLIVLVGGGYAFVRTDRIRRLYAHGAEVEGRVHRVGENAERIGWADVRYEADGQTHETRIVSGAKSYAVDAAVPMLVDPRDPKRATVRLLR